jgi:protein TonB
MPRSFFDQVLLTEAPRRGSRWIKAVSIVFHVAIVIALLVLPITAAMDLPGVFTALPPVVLAQVAPPPPPPAVATPQVQSPVPVTAPTVPMEAPQGINPEIERPPAPPPTSLGVPGGIGTPGLLTGLGTINNSTLEVPKAPEAPQGPRRVGGDIKPPQRTVYKAPQYPPAAQAARMEGTVFLEAVIDAEGIVRDIKVLKSVPLLDRAAIEAVQQWRYSPTRLNGVAIPVVMTVTVVFQLR